MADPPEYLQRGPEDDDSIGEIQQRLAAWPVATLPGLPPFQGGVAGLFSYDLSRQIESLPRAAVDEFELPAVAVGFYDVVVAFDHQQGRAWIISQGFPERTPERRRRRAEVRLSEFRRRLSGPPKCGPRHQGKGAVERITRPTLATQYDVGLDPLTSNFSRDGYLRTIERAIRYIHDGDVFQVNLAQRLLSPATDDSVPLYQRLRRHNPSPFAGYFDLGEFQILSTSPERFLRVERRTVETRPIKGTRRRTAQPEADLFAGDDLQTSDKDRAENVMIVDLLRNDLSRVCQAETVRVTELCRLETYAFVQHLVSVIVGRLRREHGPLDLLRAAFPGGSITGAPKVRAMEIIAELEPTARGAYCGSLGYVGFDGTMDTNLLIRTVTAGRGWWQAHAGGGIVAQSKPDREYEETWHKAEGMIRALVP